MSAWAEHIAAEIGTALNDEAVRDLLLAEPETDVFEAGLNSLKAFTLLDDLADLDVDIDFTALAQDGRFSFLVKQAEASGVSAP